MSETKNIIKIYGTNWCGDTRRARQFFSDHKIDYEWIDIDHDKTSAEYVKSVNNGNRSVPTIVFPDGSMLVEPSSLQLREKFNIV